MSVNPGLRVLTGDLMNFHLNVQDFRKGDLL